MNGSGYAADVRGGRLRSGHGGIGEGNTVFGPVALLRADKEPTLSSCSSVSPTPLSGATYR